MEVMKSRPSRFGQKFYHPIHPLCHHVSIRTSNLAKVVLLSILSNTFLRFNNPSFCQDVCGRFVDPSGNNDRTPHECKPGVGGASTWHCINSHCRSNWPRSTSKSMRLVCWSWMIPDRSEMTQVAMKMKLLTDSHIFMKENSHFRMPEK